MHPVGKRFLLRTASGLAVVAVAVPLLQNQTFTLSTSEQPVIRVTGDIADLVPGRPGRLVLTVHNDGDVAAEVRQLHAVPASEVPGCSISVTPWAGDMVVPASGVGTRALAVVVRGARCEGARWRLDYTATG